MAKHKVSKPFPQAVRKPSPVKQPYVQEKTFGNTYAWIGLLAAALGAILYVNTLGHQYTLDDFSSIKDNWVVKGGLKNLDLIFTKEYRYGSWNSPGSLYRPLALTLFTIEWQLAPENPLVGHLFNIILYALGGWVLWITLRRVLSGYSPLLPALAVLLFMAHPVHTEVVANIKSADEIMALLFSTLSLYSIWRYLENDKNEWLAAACGAFALAMFSKESALMFWFVIVLCLYFFSGKSMETIVRIGGILIAPIVVFLLARQNALTAQPGKEIYSILDNFIVGAQDSPSRLATAFYMCWQYLQVLVFPHPLVSDMGYPQLKPVTFPHWQAILGLLVFAGTTVWALANLTKKHFLSFTVLFFMATFVLASNVFLLIGTSYGERLLYVPSLAFTLALSWGILKMTKIDVRDSAPLSLFTGNATTAWTIAGILLAAYSFKTFTRNAAWYDSASLYAADLKTSPNSAKLNYHNALEVTKMGLDEKSGEATNPVQVEKGIEAYNRTIELYPQYHDAYGSRGLAYFRLKQYDKAFTDYQQSLKHRPNDAKVLSNMGFIYFLRNNLDSAEVVYRRSIQYDPRFVDARRNLGAVLAMKKQFPAAIEQWKEALKYDAENPTLHFYIGSAYRDMGKPEEAKPWLEKATALGHK